MGIPGLYRWVVDRYPNTLCCVAEETSPNFNAPKKDTTKPNPNGVEFDNLYIDMNGVIHPCFHPEGLPAPQSYEDVFPSIFRYIDRVFSIVRPRKLLFLAVDGVAPRAKMNHQRIRRFRASKEADGKISSERDKKLDSNVITPGTEFMALLSSALKYYVHMRMNEDPGWKNIKVILSDSCVIGEGEHKIMSYIRSQRNLQGYDPNARHCLHGLDADLIMLALATHEIHLSILREVITFGCSGQNTPMKKSLDVNSYHKPSYIESMRQYLRNLKFEFFNLWVLREYLERELLPNVKGADFERLVDDFIFICLFVGNDFLPKLPSLEISEGGIELLLIVYQEEFVKMGYLTDSFKVNLKCMEHFLQALSSHEYAIFMKRGQILKENKRHTKRRGSQGSSLNEGPIVVELESITAPNLDVDSTNKEVEVHKRYTKQRYYIEKFDHISDDFDRIKRDAVLKYTEGVCWVMHYYYQGVCSWQWFYPYHYAPLASDFCGLDKLEIHFTLGQPFKPLDQLLGVLPAASAQALPLFYRELMTKDSSPIVDFYPEDVKIEKNGKKYPWQWVCKLPFIDDSRLLSETLKVEHTLTDEEKQRNKLGKDTLFVHQEHPLAEKINNHHLGDPSLELQVKIKPELSGGMNGYLCISAKPVCAEKITSPVNGKLPILKNNRVKSVDYKYPSFHAHIPKLPCGVIMPPRILRCKDIPRPPKLWHAKPIPSNGQLRCKDKSSGVGGAQHESKDVARENYTNNEVRDGCINGKLETEIEPVEEGDMMVGNDGDEKVEGGNGGDEKVEGGNDGDEKVKGDGMLDNGTKSGMDGKLTGEEKIDDASKGGDSGLASNREHEIMGCGEPKRKRKRKRVKRNKLEAEGKDKVNGGGQNDMSVEVHLDVEGGESIEVGGKPDPDGAVGVRTKRSKRRRAKGKADGVHVEGGSSQNMNAQVNKNKMESSVVGRQLGLVEGTEMTNKISDDKGQEIKGEVKSEKRKRRKKVKDKVGAEPDIVEGKLELQPDIVEGKLEKPKRKKHKRKRQQVKEAADLVEEKDRTTHIVQS